MENLAFHSLLNLMMIILPILTTSRIHFSLGRWENVLFELGIERVTNYCGMCSLLFVCPTAEWKSLTGPVVGLNFYTLPNVCDISPDGPSPCCHLGDGYTDLVVVRPCTRLGMSSHIQRNFNSKDQVPRTPAGFCAAPMLHCRTTRIHSINRHSLISAALEQPMMRRLFE